MGGNIALDVCARRGPSPKKDSVRKAKRIVEEMSLRRIIVDEALSFCFLR